MIEQLEKILKILEEENKNRNSIWDKEQLLAVKKEMEDLYFHFKNGERYFKYGRRQRLLESSYIMTDSMEKLSCTALGKEIHNLQEMYWKL